jgi:hypothetical protein
MKPPHPGRQKTLPRDEGAESPTLHLLLVKTKQVRRAIPFDDLKKKQTSYRVQRRNKIPSKRLDNFLAFLNQIQAFLMRNRASKWLSPIESTSSRV